MSGAEPEDTDPLVGRVVLGRYRIVRELARGGMGAIYLARSEGAASFVKPVVIKRMLPEFVGDAAAAKMFKREARIMSLLRHPGVVSVFDFGREDLGYLLVMDYVHGFHLGRWAGWILKNQPSVPVDITVHIVLQVLEALQYAHSLTGPDGESLRIVHRDVSPSNVLLDVSGYVRLADFGIAQSHGDAPDVKTSTRSVKGKFSYMAPEILEGAEPTPGSDAYSAAVVLHEILIGRNEFRTASPAATIGRVLAHVPTRLDKVRADATTALADVVEQALAKKPSDRFQSAAELARALRKVRGMEAEDASALLRETFERDFHNPSLAAMYHLPDLDELERAWRMPAPPGAGSNPPGAGEPIPIDLEADDSRDPTVAGTPSAHGAAAVGASASIPPITIPDAPAAPRPAPSRTPLFLALAVALLTVIGAGVAVAVGIGRPTAPPPDIVYVEASPSGIDTRPEVAVEVDAGAAIVPEPEPEPTPEVDTSRRAGTKRRTTGPRDDASGLQRAFGRHTAAMQSCFAGAPVGGPSDLTLHFSIDERGGVQRVELAPASVASTEPGRCVTRIARAIEFPPPGQARSFRIPIEIRPR
jgi:serine/threonine protein kinase